MGTALLTTWKVKRTPFCVDCGAQSPGTGGSLTAEVWLVVAWGSILVEGNSLTGRGTHIGSVGVSLSPTGLAKVS